MRTLVVAGAAVLVGTALVGGYATIRIWAQGDRDEARPADAIVVLGAAQYDGRPSQVYEARLSHAVDLFQAGVAPILVLTGGKAPGDRTTEADAGRVYALDHGVPESAILTEEEGRTTLQSLERVAVIFEAHRLTSAVFVSDRTHMLRVLRIATDQGIEAWGSPTTTSPIDTNPVWQAEATVHELAALGIYFLGIGHLIREEQPPPGN